MFIQKIKNIVWSHKKTFLVAVLIVGASIYFFYHHSNSSSSVKYITAKVERGEVAASVTGTGQVSASNRVDVTSEVLGDVTVVPVKLGQSVASGAVLAALDARDASRAVQNAELSLENAKIAYDKASKQADLQSEGSSVSDLNQAYEDGFTAVSNALIDVPDIVATANAIFYDPQHSPYFSDNSVGLSVGPTALNYKYEAGRQFDVAKKDYDAVFTGYKSINVNDRAKLVSLIGSTRQAVKDLHSALTGAYNTIDYIKQRLSSDSVPAQVATDKTALSSAIGKLTNHLDNLSANLTKIEDAKDNTTEATLDLKSAELNVSKAEDDLRNAREALANHTVRAPFSGLVGKVNVEVGDKVSSGSAIATIITNEQVAEVTLNEVDIAKVKIGDKAKITFDAIDGLEIDGKVTEVDLLGTVSQGVVNYTVKIAFDKNDERIKTGMSLSAVIVSESKTNVLRVPSSAVKSQGNQNYVEFLKPDGTLGRITVKAGLESDDFMEIISGLAEGQSFVVRTVTSSTKMTNASAPSLFGSGRAATGSNVRFQQR